MNKTWFLLIFLTLIGCSEDKGANPTSIAYSATFSEPSDPGLIACDGEVLKEKILLSCKDNSGNLAENSKCDSITIPFVKFKSPAGVRVENIVKTDNFSAGTKTFTCSEGKTKIESEVLVECTDPSKYKLQGENNNMNSTCKSFPIKISAGKDDTCLEMSNKDYICWGKNSSFDFVFDVAGEVQNINKTPKKVLAFNNNKYFSLTFGKSAILRTPQGRLDENYLYEGNNYITDFLGTKIFAFNGSPIICLLNNYNKIYCNITYSYNFVEILGYDNIEIKDFIYSKGSYCAQTYDNKIYCSGENSVYVLGLGHNSIVDTPKYVSAYDNIKKLFATYYGFCGIFLNGEVKCIGNSSFYPINIYPELVPELFGATKIVSNQNGRCGLVNSKIICQGDDLYNNRDITYPSTNGQFIEITKITDAKDIAMGENHTCVLKNNDEVYCVGKNNLYQLAAPTSVVGSASLTPVRINYEDTAE